MPRSLSLSGFQAAANLKRHADACGLPRIDVHGLRHSYATAALRAGVPPEVVSARLGHADVSMTLNLYAHVMERDDQEAAEMVAGVFLHAGR